MNSLPSSPTAETRIDARLEQIIEAAINQLQDGHAIDAESLAAAHPNYAEQLRELLPMVATMVGLGKAAAGVASEPSAINGHASPTQQQLGDFRLIREIGRGGMGTVYEAEQISMGRRVALKVLPFAALVQDKSLQRFRNEVRAAASLDHPHIVSVYSIGEERGVHFYAMQLIRGQTLAEMIQELRKPESRSREPSGSCPARLSGPTDEEYAPTIDSSVTSPPTTTHIDQARISTAIDSRHAKEFYRNAARLGVQAAEALQHAHDQGVLHRDIKPSNLLLDREVNVYVTDFGLARIEADAGMTMTGDIVGTLRYMAPEQALAKRVVIDHRADIYSLGATLYELLTLQPAFSETDRSELLKQIAFEEPNPLRKVDRQIPTELETIVLKAMSKERDDRYQTAQKLASDLRAFLEYRPIKAKPPSLSDQAWKWSQRHKALVAMAGLALMLLSATLVVSMAFVKRAESRALAALDETSALLYAADMTVAYQAYEKGWTDEVQAILKRHRFTNAKRDRRGFEWHLLNRLAQQPESHALTGHRDHVRELAVFPDGRRLASVGDDGTLRIWDVRTRQLLQTTKFGGEALHSVAISPNGRYVAAGAKTIYLCDLDEDRVSQIYRSEHNFESLAFRPDGQAIAAGARYHDVFLLSLDGEVLGRIACASRVESLEFTREPPRLIVPNRRESDIHDDGIIQLWDDSISRFERALDYPANITMSRLSPCEEFIAAGYGYRSMARVFHLESGRVVAETRPSRDNLTDMSFAPDGNTLAIAYANGIVERYKVQRDGAKLVVANTRPSVIGAHQGAVHSVRYLDADIMATCGADGIIQLWNSAEDADLSFETKYERSLDLDLSPDGSLLLSRGIRGYQLFDTNDGGVVRSKGLKCLGRATAAWSPDSKRVLICLALREEKEPVRILDRSGRFLLSLPVAGEPYAVAFSPDGKMVAISTDQGLYLCDSYQGSVLHQAALKTPVHSLAFSNDGKTLAYGGYFEEVVLLDVTQARQINALPCNSYTSRLAYSPDGSILASGHRDGVIQLWEAASGRPIAELVGHGESVQDIAFSPDSGVLLSGAMDGAIRLWSVEHRRGYGVIQGRDPQYCRTSLSSDGSRLAIGYLNREDNQPVLLWRIHTSVKN